jgi:hypothetical protein
VFELPMASACAIKVPTIGFNKFDCLANFHRPKRDSSALSTINHQTINKHDRTDTPAITSSSFVIRASSFLSLFVRRYFRKDRGSQPLFFFFFFFFFFFLFSTPGKSARRYQARGHEDNQVPFDVLIDIGEKNSLKKVEYQRLITVLRSLMLPSVKIIRLPLP